MKCDYCGREFTRGEHEGARRYCTDPDCERMRTAEYNRAYARDYRRRKREEGRTMEIQLKYVPPPRQWRGAGLGRCPECQRLEDAFRRATGARVLEIMAERYAHMEAAHGIPYRREVEQLELEGVR